MSTYTLYTTTDGCVNIMAETRDKKVAMRLYRGTYLCRVAVNGRELSIHEADKLLGAPMGWARKEAR